MQWCLCGVNSVVRLESLCYISVVILEGSLLRWEFGLTVSIPKTNGQAVSAVSEGDVSPVEVGSEMVKDFTYLSSNLSSDCEATCEVKCRIIRASETFGPLPIPIFSNFHLYVNIKRTVSGSFPSCCIISAETWTLKVPDVHMLATFCVHTILGVTRYSQWKEHITTK